MRFAIRFAVPWLLLAGIWLAFPCVSGAANADRSPMLSAVVAIPNPHARALDREATLASRDRLALTVRQADRYLPTRAQTRTLVAGLRRLGLAPTLIGGGTAVAVTGPASRVRRLADSPSRVLREPVTVSVFPARHRAAFSHAIAVKQVPYYKGGRRARLFAHATTTSGGPAPCSALAQDAQSNGGYTADEIAQAYNLGGYYQAGDAGQGETIGLLELEPNLTSDIAAFQSCYGTSTTVNYTAVDGGAGTGAGSGEAALDIEQIISLAPRATIDVYQAPNTTTGLLDAYSAMVNNPSINVISTSWGLCEPGSGAAVIDSENTLFQKAAGEGKTVVAAAGDSGSDDCQSGTLAVDDPASQPYVTGVGGTSLSDFTQPALQTTWNDSLGAGGGGISAFWPMPSWQQDAASSLGVLSSASGGPCGQSSGYCREVPDVSADADPNTGYWIIHTDSAGQQAELYGGTSAAAPLWAAFTALANASAACAGTALGDLNPLLYRAAGSDYASRFFDITSGTNADSSYGYPGGLYAAAAGYDMASGLGAPNGVTLGDALCTGGETITVATPPAQTTTQGQGASLTVTASDSLGRSLVFSAGGLPPGLAISSAGQITGAPTQPGVYTVAVTATDPSDAQAQSVSFPWTVVASQTQASVTSTGTGSGAGTGTAAGPTAGPPAGTASGTATTTGTSTAPGAGVLGGTGGASDTGPGTGTNAGKGRRLERRTVSVGDQTATLTATPAQVCLPPGGRLEVRLVSRRARAHGVALQLVRAVFRFASAPNGRHGSRSQRSRRASRWGVFSVGSRAVRRLPLTGLRAGRHTLTVELAYGRARARRRVALHRFMSLPVRICR